MNQQSWLYSDSFLKRAFAIWGHYFVANLIIGAVVFVVAFVVAAVLGVSLSQLAQPSGANVEIQQ